MRGDVEAARRSCTRVEVAAAITCLLAACVFLSSVKPALALEALPEVEVAEGGNAVTWKAAGLPEGWGYKVAVAQCQEHEPCAEPNPQYFEVEKSAAAIQSFVPYAQNITDFTPIGGGTVYIGVAVLPLKGKSPLGYSAPRVAVKVNGVKLAGGVFGAPPFVWTEGESVDWNPLTGTEWGYKIAVSRQPQCFPVGEPKCRETETFERPLATVNPQTFTPCLGRIKFTPFGGIVYVGIGTLKAQFSNPASYTGSEVSVKVSECAPPEVASTSATSITLTSAALNGTVNPKGSNIKACRFEYGTTEMYGTSVECAKLPLGEGSASVTAALAGLAPKTLYHFRLVAQGDLTSRSGFSGDATFTTAAPPPQPPVNILAPTIGGLPIAGLSLTSSAGVWERQPTAFSYQWQRCDAAGVLCADIAGATSNTFPLSITDIGHRMRLVVAAHNADGATPASSAVSAVVGATVQSEARWGVELLGSLTLVQSVEIPGLLAGARVALICRGHGCPFHIRQIVLRTHRAACHKRRCQQTRSAPVRQVDLGFPFGHHPLKRGVVLAARVVISGWIGRETKIVLRAGRPPKKLVLCLAPGSTRAVHCPS